MRSRTEHQESSKTLKTLVLIGTVILVALVTGFATSNSLSTGSHDGRSKLFGQNRDVTRNGRLPIGDIVGGSKASSSQFPYMVSVWSVHRTTWSTNHCGGVIYNSTTIISAAHCTVSNGLYLVYAGSVHLQLPQQIRTVAAVRNHPNYNDGSGIHAYANDVSVITLKTPLTFNNYVQAAHFPEPWQEISIGTVVRIMGWGRTCRTCGINATLLYTTEEVKSDKTCQSLYSQNFNSTTMICVGGDSESGACRGDSGGAMIGHDSAGDVVVFGIMSWGLDCDTSYPSVFTKLSEFVDWIGPGPSQ